MEESKIEVSATEPRRVMFVDDDVLVLRALQRAFRRFGQVDAAFATSGEEALAQLRQAPVDIVVTDLRMPGMDGAALLREVRTEMPDVVRIILTGSTPAVSDRLDHLAHQMLEKPQAVDRIAESLMRVFRARTFLVRHQLRDAANGVDTLPSPPQLLLRLSSEMAADGGSAQRIAEIIEEDPAMTAKVLQLVNSSFYGPKCEIASVRRAVVHVGTNAIRALATGLSVFQAFVDSRGLRLLDVRSMQLEGMVTAGLAGSLLRDPQERARAYTAATLKDVGQLVLATQLPALYREQKDAAVRTRQPLHAFGYETLGVSHAEIGAYLLGVWGLPASLVDAVGRQFLPRTGADTEFDAGDALYLARSVVDAVLGRPTTADGALDEAWLAHHGVAEEQLETMRHQARVDWAA